jgi:hypothetical protein
MDNLILYRADGASSFNLGSWLRADPGPDFGETDLLKANFSENPAAEGAELAFETVNHRPFTIPLRIASHSAWGGLQGAEAQLRQLARPGAYIDLQLDGVASAEAVRFDVIAGRYEVTHDVRMAQQLDRREGTLKLDVQPFGYWPTMILLASSASVGLPGSLDIPNASIVGDVAGQAQVFVQPTVGTSYSSGTWFPDMLGWSLAGRPSLPGLLGGGSWSTFGVGVGVATRFADSLAPAATVFQQFYPVGATGWQGLAYWQVASALEPAFRGLFRTFAYVKWSPSTVLCAKLTADVIPDTAFVPDRPIGSAAPVASLVPDGGGSMFVSPSPGYQLLDLGLQSLPALASGQTSLSLLRLWFNAGTNTAATSVVTLGGVFLLPVDGAAGVVPAGLAQPTIYQINSSSKNNKFIADGVGQLLLHSRQVTGDVGTGYQPDYNMMSRHFGVFPAVGASTTRLDLIAGSRKWAASGATAPIVHSAPLFASVAVKYRPRFTFLKGL